MLNNFQVALHAIFVGFLVDYVFIRIIYRPPTDDIEHALKGYFPTYYLYYYNLTELQTLATALRKANDDAAHSVWIDKAFGFTLFVRQILPMSGLFYVEILAGHVYGLLRGLGVAWLAEVTGAIASYLLTVDSRLFNWSPTSNPWTYFQKMIGFLDGSFRARRAQGKTGASLRTRLISVYLLSLLRALTLLPNWALNSAAVELGVPFGEFTASTLLGAFPHLYYSIRLGTRLLAQTNPVDEDFTAFYILLGAWAFSQVVLAVSILRLIKRKTTPEQDPQVKKSK